MKNLQDKVNQRIEELKIYDLSDKEKMLIKNELRWVLEIIKQEEEYRKCENCKHIKIWVKKQGELKDNIYTCNYSECQNIKEFYCGKFKGVNK